MNRDLKLMVAGSIPGSDNSAEFLLYREYAFGTTNCTSRLINYVKSVTAARNVVHKSPISCVVGSSLASSI